MSHPIFLVAVDTLFENITTCLQLGMLPLILGRPPRGQPQRGCDKPPHWGTGGSCFSHGGYKPTLW